MTEKELRKLHRHDLLELLVEQSREAARLNTALKENEEELAAVMESNERIKAKLDEKDGLIEKLKGRLDEKDAELENAASGAEEQLNRFKSELDEKNALIEKLKSRLDEKDRKLEADTAAAEETFNRLKGKLDEKDAQIGKLREQLEQKDEKIGKLEAYTERLRTNTWKEMKDSGLPAELLARLKALI